MKFGSDNPVVRIGVVALLVVSVAWFGRTMWKLMSGPDLTAAPPAAAAAPAQPRTRPAPAGAQKGSLITLEKRLDPTLRLDLLKASEETVYKGSGRNIFSAYAPPPAPPPTPVVSPVIGQQQQTQQGPPPPPPINLKFYGFASRPGEPKKIFLARGDDIFIAGEGDIVARQYRVVRIGPTFVEIEDVLNNQRQSIPLTS